MLCNKALLYSGVGTGSESRGLVVRMQARLGPKCLSLSGWLDGRVGIIRMESGNLDWASSEEESLVGEITSVVLRTSYSEEA